MSKSNYPSYRNPAHAHVRDFNAFGQAVTDLVGSLKIEQGLFVSDNLLTFGRNLSFLDDTALIAAWKAHCEDLRDRSVLWRTATLAWAARNAARLEGDFAEFGVYRGVSARILADLIDFGTRNFWLYDTWEAIEGQKTLPAYDGGSLEEAVRAKFAAFPNVKLIKGFVPDSFSQGLPERVAFAHIDMNNAPAELFTLDALESRLVPGAQIVLDDYGWLMYRSQYQAESKWFAKRGRHVLELPTGQGLVVW